MKICLQLFFLAFIYIIFSCNTSHTSNEKLSGAPLTSLRDSLLIKERLKLKKYALCKCLLTKYPNDSFLLRDGSLEGFLETSSYGNHAYEAIDSFVQAKSSARYESKYKKNLYVMQCMDIYEDPELESLVRKFDTQASVSE